MKAMILAGGLGTRLRPLTYSIPKPMLRIDKKPLLQYQLELLRKYGLKECAINLYHLPEKIKGYFGDGSIFGVRIKYLIEKELSGTASPLKKLEKYFKKETFVIIYGDNLTNIDLKDLISYHEKKGGIITIALYYEKHPESKGIVQIDGENRILSFKEKPNKEEITTHWANTGIYVCEPEVLNFIPKNKFYDFGKDLFPRLIQSGLSLYSYKIKDYLLDIGTPETYQKAQKDIKKLRLFKKRK